MEDLPIYPNSFQTMNVSSYYQDGRKVSISADEAAIIRRGKRRIPASFSPERSDDEVAASPMTPSDQSQPRRGMTVRKNLFSGGDGPVQSDTASVAASPAKKMKTTPELTINSFTINNNDPASETPKKVKALSRVQLVKLVNDMTLCPDFMEKIAPLLPEEPDITSQLANLEKQNRNVFRAMPKTRLSNHHDSISYSWVQLHLKSFHQVLVDDLHALEMSEHWPTVIRYVLGAWPIVDKSPVWEDSIHNKLRLSCFINLANVGVKAIKSYQFEESVRENLLFLMVRSSFKELQGHINFLKSL